MSQPVHVPELREHVRRHFAATAARYGLDGARVTARYVLNWGGFVNHSFTVADGSRAFHLKLAEHEECRAALRRWADVHELLEARYHAPRLQGWVDLPVSRCAGLLFEHIDARELDVARDRSLLAKIVDVVGALHCDAALADALSGVAPAGTCADFLCSTYVERFDEDLAIVIADKPDFVADETMAWMASETRRLEAAAREAPAFQCPADAPVHGDLWPANVLVTPAGGWYIVDWDDLSLGDPAHDIILLVLPLALRAEGAEWASTLPVRLDDGATARLPLYRRALLLDAVIDVLADYLEAAKAPQHADEVRARRAQDHRDALALYRRRYG